MNYDDILNILGQFGRYQRMQFFLVCLVSITSSFHAMNMVFVGPTPNHYCDVPNKPGQWENLTEEQELNVSIPWDEDDERERCQMYNIDEVNWTVGDYESWYPNMVNVSTEKCRDGWIYTQEYYKSTIVSEWDLVCDDVWLRSMATTIFFAGRLVGALLSGQLSDIFGRRPVFFVALLCQLIIGVAVALSPVLWLFYCLYFLQGVAQVAVYLSSYVIGTEMVGPKYRKVAGFFVNYFYAAGQIILAGIAYGIKEWRYIEIAITLPSIFFFAYFWLLPESVRWLLAQGKRSEAEAVLKKTARINKVELTEEQLASVEVGSKDDKKYTVIDLFRNYKTALISINVWFCWMVNSLVYYGLNLNTSNLAGDPYVNFIIAAAVEFPSLTLGILIVDRSGRRWLTLAFMFLAGAGCIATAFVPDDMDWLATTFSMVGKFGISASYTIIYIVAAEVFPTVVRNVGMGMASVFARVGGMIAPQVVLLGEYIPELPLLLFGILSIISAILVIFLPESTGKPLPQTMDDLINMDQGIASRSTEGQTSSQISKDFLQKNGVDSNLHKPSGFQGYDNTGSDLVDEMGGQFTKL